MTIGTTIRPATLPDVPALHRLVESAYRGDSARRGWTHEANLLDDERTSPEVLAATLAQTNAHVLIAETDAGLVGTITVIDQTDGRAYLGMLCVDPALQANGLGRALITAAEAFARDRFGARMIEMTVIDRRAELIAWYERLGYRRTGETRPFPAPGPFPFALVVLDRDLVPAATSDA